MFEHYSAAAVCLTPYSGKDYRRPDAGRICSKENENVKLQVCHGRFIRLPAFLLIPIILSKLAPSYVKHVVVGYVGF